MFETNIRAVGGLVGAHMMAEEMLNGGGAHVVPLYHVLKSDGTVRHGDLPKPPTAGWDICENSSPLSACLNATKAGSAGPSSWGYDGILLR